MGSTRREAALYGLSLVALAACFIASIWSVDYLPLKDLHNHLASLFIIHNYEQFASFQQNYAIDRVLLPNLGLEIVGLPLMRLFDVYTVGKIALSLYVALFTLGCDRLGRALHGRATWMAPIATYFCFNAAFLDGYLNYSLGVALFLLSFAFWLRHRAAPTTRTVVASSALAAASWLTHLSAAAFFVIGALVYLAADLRSERRLRRRHILAAIPILPPLLLHAALVMHAPLTQRPEWSTAWEKLKALGMLYGGSDVRTDRALLVLLALAALGALAGRPRQRGPWLPFVLSGVLAACFLVSPDIAANGDHVDVRFLVPSVLVALLGLRLTLGKRAAAAVLALGLAASFGRAVAVGVEWRKRSPEIAEQVRLIRMLPEQIDLYPLLFEHRPGGLPSRVAIGYRHLSLYAVIERRAANGRVFGFRGSHLLRLRNPGPSWRSVDDLDESPEGIDWHAVFARYPYIWGFQLPPAYRDRLDSSCRRVGEAGPVILFGPCGDPAR